MSRLALSIAALLLACAGGRLPAQDRRGPATLAPAPTLLVLVTIDQFRADYLERFAPQLTGGLGRLVRGGAVFTNAFHDHAITETAPGHATLLSGRFPRSTGITMNSVGVGDPDAPLIAGGLGAGASPRRFAGTTLVDWLRSKDARSRALSVSVKDRGAILPAGRSKADVYWYSADGRFITSSYYRDTLPAWVTRFNARHLPQRYAGRSWNLLLGEQAYPERDSVSAESNGVNVAFPYALSADSLDAASQLRATPFIDEVTVAFALHGVEALRLGTGTQTDLLAVSLSSTDYVGHGYGPDSREMHDQVLRDDRTIGFFLDSLYRLRDSSRVVVVLSSDHGVGTIPEIAAASSTPGATRVDLGGLTEPLRARLRAAGVDTLAVERDQQLLLVDRAAFRSAAGLDSIIGWFADSARAIRGVRRVDRFTALLADSSRTTLARRWSHQLPAQAPVALVVTLDSLSTWGGNVASHGSAYDHDAHVPLIFYGSGVRPGRYPGVVRTVDLAPTLAALAGVAAGQPIDGIVLRQAIR